MTPSNPDESVDRPSSLPPEERLALNLTSEQASVARVAEAVALFATGHGWDESLRFAVDLVVEEVVQNIVSYGYPDGRTGSFTFHLTQSETHIHIRVEDDGIGFDPFQQAAPDLELGIGERPIGGLGIHLIREMMDDHGYCRVGARNRIDLSKRLASTGD